MEGTSLVLSNKTSIEVSVGSIEFTAVLEGLVSILSSSFDFASSEAVGLVELRHSESESGIFEQDFSWVLGDPSISYRVRSIFSWDLDSIASVSSVSSFSGISGWVVITTSPLEVNVITNSGIHVLRDEVVFSGGVGLDNISSLSSNVQVEDSGKGRNSIGSLDNVEDMRSILEGSSELSGIEGEFQFSSGNIFIDDGVLSDWRSIVIHGVISKTSIRSGHIWISFFNRGDVVSHSEDAVAVSIVNAVFISTAGKSPVVVVGKSSILLSVTQVVFS